MQLSFIARLDALNRLLTRRISLILSFLAVISCLLGFGWLKQELGMRMLDEMSGYDSEMLNTQMLLYGESGRALHLRFTLILDMVFPLAYGAFLGGLLVLAARGIFDKAVLAPVLAVMVLDVSENVQIALMLAQFPDLGMQQIAFASATTLAKFWAIWFFLMWLAGLVLWNLWVRLRARDA